MGDISAVSGSEVILRISKLTTYYQDPCDHDLSEVIQWYLRFWDDLSLKLTGTMDRMMAALQIITTTNPTNFKLITLNF